MSLRLLEWSVRRIVPPADCEAFLGDLLESYGRHSAQCWRELARSAFPFVRVQLFRMAALVSGSVLALAALSYIAQQTTAAVDPGMANVLVGMWVLVQRMLFPLATGYIAARLCPGNESGTSVAIGTALAATITFGAAFPGGPNTWGFILAANAALPFAATMAGGRACRP